MLVDASTQTESARLEAETQTCETDTEIQPTAGSALEHNTIKPETPSSPLYNAERCNTINQPAQTMYLTSESLVQCLNTITETLKDNPELNTEDPTQISESIQHLKTLKSQNIEFPSEHIWLERIITAGLNETQTHALRMVYQSTQSFPITDKPLSVDFLKSLEPKKNTVQAPDQSTSPKAQSNEPSTITPQLHDARSRAAHQPRKANKLGPKKKSSQKPDHRKSSVPTSTTSTLKSTSACAIDRTTFERLFKCEAFDESVNALATTFAELNLMTKSERNATIQSFNKSNAQLKIQFDPLNNKLIIQDCQAGPHKTRQLVYTPTSLFRYARADQPCERLLSKNCLGALNGNRLDLCFLDPGTETSVYQYIMPMINKITTEKITQLSRFQVRAQLAGPIDLTKATDAFPDIIEQLAAATLTLTLTASSATSSKVTKRTSATRQKKQLEFSLYLSRGQVVVCIQEHSPDDSLQWLIPCDDLTSAPEDFKLKTFNPTKYIISRHDLRDPTHPGTAFTVFPSWDPRLNTYVEMHRLLQRQTDSITIAPEHETRPFDIPPIGHKAHHSLVSKADAQGTGFHLVGTTTHKSLIGLGAGTMTRFCPSEAQIMTQPIRYLLTTGPQASARDLPVYCQLAKALITQLTGQAPEFVEYQFRLGQSKVRILPNGQQSESEDQHHFLGFKLDERFYVFEEPDKGFLLTFQRTVVAKVTAERIELGQIKFDDQGNLQPPFDKHGYLANGHHFTHERTKLGDKNHPIELVTTNLRTISKNIEPNSKAFIVRDGHKTLSISIHGTAVLDVDFNEGKIKKIRAITLNQKTQSTDRVPDQLRQLLKQLRKEFSKESCAKFVSCFERDLIAALVETPKTTIF